MSDHFHIIGNPTSEKELEDQWNAFQSEPVDHQRKADDECLRVHGQTNKERYEKFKSEFLKKDIPYPSTEEIDNMIIEAVEGEIEYPEENIEKARYWGVVNTRAIVYPTKLEEDLNELWYQFNSMIRKNQRESDWKSLELFGVDNKTHYEYLKSKFLKQDIPDELDAVEDEVDYSTVMGEACKDIKTARKFVRDVGRLAKKYDANYFIVTDGASGTSNDGNPAVRNARNAQIEWEKKNGFDPDEDWAKKESQIDKNDYVLDDSIEYFKDNIADLTSVPDEALPYYDLDEIEYLIPDDSARYDREIDMDVFSRSFSIREWRNSYKEFCENGTRFNTREWEREVARVSNKLESARVANKDTLKLENALLSLGWNPSIPFNEKTRMIGSIRYANKHPYEIMDEAAIEAIDEASKVDRNLEPVYIVLVQGTSVFSNAIKLKTKGPFSHAAIGLDHTLENLFSYNIDTFGLAPESVKRYGKDTHIGVYCVFVKAEDKKKIENTLKDFIKNKDKTHYSFLNVFTFVAGIPVEKQFDKICSQFVDSVLKLADIDLTKKASSLVSPNDFMYAAVTNKKIYKLYEGKCGDFDAGELKYKTNKLKKNAMYIKEAKELPVRFDDSGNLLIKNMKRLDFEHEYAACHKLLLSYDKTNNIEGMKYELSKLWFMNHLIEKKRHDKNTKPEEKQALDKARAKILNDFYKYLDIVQKAEPEFNFTEYYEESPFSDVVYKVSPSTLKFTVKTIKDLVF